MSECGERAYALFCEGYNCAQSTFAALCPLTGLDQKTALRLASGLGGGVARQREVCGAVLGMSMAAGLLRDAGCSVTVTLDGSPVVEYPIRAGAAVERMEMPLALRRLLAALCGGRVE